jgi:hypothetical protein
MQEKQEITLEMNECMIESDKWFKHHKNIRLEGERKEAAARGHSSRVAYIDLVLRRVPYLPPHERTW